MRRREKKRLTTILLILLIGGLSMLAKHFGWIDESGNFNPPGTSNNAPGTTGTKKSLGAYELLGNCTLAKDRDNDGDSFLVRHGNDEYVFRLYFVDCPEKRLHRYNGDRIHEQALYFGISDDAAIRTGVAARDFTLNLLGNGPFDVATKWERVYGSERFYAFVTPSSGGGNSDAPSHLCETLISRGLGRIHTKGSNLPSGTPWRKFRNHLKNVESTAKSAQRGGWGR